jgi:CheY-like chemotaxis protein
VATGLLQQAGYRVTAFESPLQALAAFQARPDGFDLVVTDHNMPGLSGLDIARSLTGLRPGLPVVVSSGYVSDALQADAARAGVRQVMQKEYMHEQLVNIVNRLLAEPAGPDSAGGGPGPAAHAAAARPADPEGAADHRSQTGTPSAP